MTGTSSSVAIHAVSNNLYGVKHRRYQRVVIVHYLPPRLITVFYVITIRCLITVGHVIKLTVGYSRPCHYNRQCYYSMLCHAQLTTSTVCEWRSFQWQRQSIICRPMAAMGVGQLRFPLHGISILYENTREPRAHSLGFN